ncbi:MAG: hypothetical protein EP350_06950 [Alphaproteobacteria bacterium]|nr:MAG: hypothetical protein EP350_06950 [Alphaproteobacteria bacterium]
MASDNKRLMLSEKIEAGRKRLAEREIAQQAIEAAQAATGFVRKHPLATLGGAIGIGLAVGALTKSGRKLGKRGGILTGLLIDAALAYGVKLIEQAAEAAKTKADDDELID